MSDMVSDEAGGVSEEVGGGDEVQEAAPDAEPLLSTDSGEEDLGEDGSTLSYEAFTVPEGLELDEALVEKAAPILKELGVDQSGAQKLVDLISESRTRDVEQFVRETEAQEKAWVSEIRDDPDYGGAKLAASRTRARRALQHYGGESIIVELGALGGLNHPALFRMLARVGADLGDDKVVRAGERVKGQRSLAERLLPSHGRED